MLLFPMYPVSPPPRLHQPTDGGAVNLHSWGLRFSWSLSSITTSLWLQNPETHYSSARGWIQQT